MWITLPGATRVENQEIFHGSISVKEEHIVAVITEPDQVTVTIYTVGGALPPIRFGHAGKAIQFTNHFYEVGHDLRVPSASVSRTHNDQAHPRA